MTNNEIILRTQNFANTNMRNIGFAYKGARMAVYDPNMEIKEIHVFSNDILPSDVYQFMFTLGFYADAPLSKGGNCMIFKKI